MYITIKNKDFTSAQNLASILYVMKKEDLLKIAKRLDFWIGPISAHRVAKPIMH